MGFFPHVASRSWYRCIAYSTVPLIEGLLCHSPACRLAYLSTSEVVPPSLVLHIPGATAVCIQVQRAASCPDEHVPVRVCGTQAPASEMGTGNSASHLRVCRTNLDG